MKTENLTIDRRYGRVLFETAKESQELETVFEELNVLRDVYNDEPELGKLLSDKRLKTLEKEQLLSTLTSQFTDKVAKFITVVFNHGRMMEMPQIISVFNDFYHSDKGVLVAEVISAEALTTEQCEQLEVKIAQLFDCQKVVLEKTIDPDILGGFIIKTANKILDNSVKKQLTMMHKQIVK